MKKFTLLFVLVLTVVIFVENAQSQEVEVSRSAFNPSKVRLGNRQVQDFFLDMASDGERFLRSYINPVVESTIYNMSNGWYRTAKSHELWGFDFSVITSASFIPASSEKFSFKNSDQKVFKLRKKDIAELSSFFGEGSQDQLLFSRERMVPEEIKGRITENDVKGLMRVYALSQLPYFSDFKDYMNDEFKVKIPSIKAVPFAAAQLGLGLPFKTDLSIKFLPRITTLVDEGFLGVGLWGVGIKHDVLQYFDFSKDFPFLNVSVFGGFTRFTSDYKMDKMRFGLDSDDLQIPDFRIFTDVISDFRALATVHSSVVQLLGSLDFKFVNFYGGIGYVMGDFELEENKNIKASVVNGFDFTISPDRYIGSSSNKIIFKPEDLNLKWSASSVKATLGMSLNLYFFRIYGDYTFQEFHNANLGVAFSFR